jgi:phage terminase Nu1 subunit (DNA packaging protein)
MTPGDTIVKGLQAVALHFDKSVRQVQRWVKEPGFPRLSGRRFDLLQIQAWLDGKDGRPPISKTQHHVDPRQLELPVQRGKDYEEQRLKRFKADLAELELRKTRGELIEVAGLEALLAPRAMAYRQGLISFEQILAPRLAAALGLPPESMRVMKAVIHEVAGEVLANVLRALTLPAGQALQWEGAPAAPDEQL